MKKLILMVVALVLMASGAFAATSDSILVDLDISEYANLTAVSEDIDLYWNSPTDNDLDGIFEFSAEANYAGDYTIAWSPVNVPTGATVTVAPLGTVAFPLGGSTVPGTVVVTGITSATQFADYQLGSIEITINAAP